MANKTNTEAVTTNIENFLSQTLSYLLEDLSSTAEPTPAKPLVVVAINDIVFEENFGEVAKEYTISYLIRVRFIEADIADARDFATDKIWEIREGLKVGILNAGAVLGTSKMVNWVRHGRAIIEYGENGANSINYPVGVEVIEERTV